MLNKLLQSSSQLPFVQNKQSQMKNHRQSMKSDTQSVSLANLSSTTNKKLNMKTDKGMTKMSSTGYKMKRMNSSNENSKVKNFQIQQNNSNCFNMGDSVTSQLSHTNFPQSKTDFAQSKIFLPSSSNNKSPQKTNTQQPTTIQQKLQNVSCLYTNHLYSSSNQNFVDEMKLEKYRLLVENERQQKHVIMRQLTEKKQLLANLEKQKGTVMFAYQTLEIKLKQHEKMLKKLRFDRRKQKLSIDIKQNRNNIRKDIDSESNIDSDNLTKRLEEEYRKTRQLMTENGIMLSQESLGLGERNCNSLSGFNTQKNRSKRRSDNEEEQEWIERCEEMEMEMKELQQKMNQMKETNIQLTQINQQLQQELTNCKNEHIETVKTLTETQLSLQASQNKAHELQIKLTQTQLQLQNTTQQLQRTRIETNRKQQMILSLQQSNYLYLQKQQREQQQIELLREFTNNLKLSDEKIAQFVQQIFNDKLEQPKTGDRLFKEDLSYVLHLVKKKQTLYEQLIKEYQDKTRQTQARCYLIEKKLLLAEAMVKKVEVNQERLEQQWNSITNKNNTQPNRAQVYTSSKPNSTMPPFIDEVITKSIQQLKSILETYHLDKRML